MICLWVRSRVLQPRGELSRLFDTEFIDRDRQRRTNPNASYAGRRNEVLTYDFNLRAVPMDGN
jgi:hypothetical protein